MTSVQSPLKELLRQFNDQQLSGKGRSLTSNDVRGKRCSVTTMDTTLAYTTSATTTTNIRFTHDCHDVLTSPHEQL